MDGQTVAPFAGRPGVGARLIGALLLVLFVLGGGSRVFASERLRIPLTKFNAPGIVRLGGNENGVTLHVPAPRRWQIEAAGLELSWVNSTALLASRSRLVVLFNDYPLAQITLEPGAPEGEASLDIPARLFEVGYNTLKIQVTQNNKDEGCIPQDPPETWTTLRLIDSSLNLDYSLREVPLSLASVADFLFDPRIGAVNRVHVVTESLDDQNVRLAVLAAAAVALRFDYRPVRFSSGAEVKPGVDNILIGTRAFAENLLGKTSLSGDLGILPLPGREGEPPDRRHGLVVLSGRDSDDVERSVRAFSILSLPLPDIQFCRVRDVELPEITEFSGRNRLEPSKRYTLDELGMGITTFRGYRPEPVSVIFTLPTNLFLEENRDIILSLDLAYSAALREDSLLSMDINGEFVASVPLDHAEGGQYRGYRIRLPLSYLSPGRNELSFHPTLIPRYSKDCELFQDRGVALTIFPTSTIQMPRLARWVRMPQLSYLFNDGFPLTAYPDFRSTRLILSERLPESTAAALNLIAGISQRTGVLPYELKMATDLADRPENYLVVGSRASLPETILDASPLAKGISMPVYGRLPGTLKGVSWKKALARWLLEENVDREPVRPDIALLDTDLKIRLHQAVLSEFESPLRAMSSVVLLTAEKPEDLLRASLVLQDEEVRYQCRNGFALIDFSGRKPSVQVAALTPSYSVGEITWQNRITWLVDRYRWSFVFTVLVLTFLAALLLLYLLRRRQRARMALGRDGEEDV